MARAILFEKTLACRCERADLELRPRLAYLWRLRKCMTCSTATGASRERDGVHRHTAGMVETGYPCLSPGPCKPRGAWAVDTRAGRRTSLRDGAHRLSWLSRLVQPTKNPTHFCGWEAGQPSRASTTQAKHHGSNTAPLSAVSSSSHTARNQRFNQGGRPDSDLCPYSCATVPDLHRLRLSALPSGARAPWLRASKSTCHWQTQRLSCGKHTTAGSHTQLSSAVMAQKPAFPRPTGSGIRGCITLPPCSGRPNFAH